MMMSIVKVVIVPIVGGILVNSLFGNVVQKYVKLLPLISVVAIVLIVGGVVAVSSQRIMETGALIMLVVMLHNLLGYALGFGIARRSAWISPRLRPSPSKSACRTPASLLPSP